MKVRIKLTSTIRVAVAAPLLLFACRNESPTAPVTSNTTTWTGVITYSGVQAHPCSPSEQITVSVNVAIGSMASGTMSASFSSNCYGSTLFVGQVSGAAVVGQLQLGQGCGPGPDGECCLYAAGQASGTFDSTHIHLESTKLQTSRCDFGSSVIDLHR